MAKAIRAHSTRVRDLSRAQDPNPPSVEALAAAAGLEARICHAMVVLSREAERIENKRARLLARLDVLRALEASVELAELRVPLPPPTMCVEA
jgi:hypothetical protein